MIDHETWSQLIEAVNDDISHELWVSAITAVAQSVIEKQGTPSHSNDFSFDVAELIEEWITQAIPGYEWAESNINCNTCQ